MGENNITALILYFVDALFGLITMQSLIGEET